MNIATIEMPFDELTAMEIKEKKRDGRIMTRDGFSVRILAMDAKSTYPIVGLVDLGEQEYTRMWTNEGKADYRRHVKSNYDLHIEIDQWEQ